MDRYQREAGRSSYPFFPPTRSSSRYSENDYMLGHPAPLQHPIAAFHPYAVPSRPRCSCGSQLNVIEQKVTSIHAMVTALMTSLDKGQAPSEERAAPEIPPPIQSPSNAMSTSESAGVEETVRVANQDVPIPSTSKERKELITRMEKELEQRKEQNKQHEERIKGLRQELEQLRARKKPP